MERPLSADRDLKFNITSGLLKTYQTPDGQRRLKTVASSTIKDRGGDVMTENAIRRMADSAKQNMTIFLNHSYSVPEDVFGSVEDVTVVRRGDVWDLDFDVRLNDSNPRAMKTYEAIENGTKLGTSIGARIREDGAKRDKSTGGWVFDDIELLEASIVGIPANPRSWVQHAVKSLEPNLTTDIKPDVQDGTTWVETTPEGAVKVVVETDPPSEPDSEPEPDAAKAAEAEVVKDDSAEILPEEEPGKPAKKLRHGTPKTQEEADDLQNSESADLTKNADPDENDPDAEAPVAQEGQPTGPEAAEDGESPEAEVDKAEAVGLQLGDFTGMLDLLKATMDDLVETRKQLLAMSAAQVKAEGDRDRAQHELDAAKGIIDSIADLPIGRRAGFDTGVRDFRAKFSSLYGDDFLKMLEKKNDA